MPKFHTGLHTSDYHRYPTPPYRGRGWSINFVKQTTEFPQGGEYSGNKFYPYKEVIISARDEITAQRAATTIFNARNLLQGSNLFGMLGGSPQRVTPVVPKSHTKSQPEPQKRPDFNASQNIPLACLVAARVSQKLRFVYALARLALSLEIMSVPTIDLDPTHSPNIPKSVFPEDHIRFATASVVDCQCAFVLPLQSPARAFTTEQMMGYERDTIAEMRKGQNLDNPLVSPETWRHVVEKHPHLSDSQRGAVEQILTSTTESPVLTAWRVLAKPLP